MNRDRIVKGQAIRENLDRSLTENTFYLPEENFKEIMEAEVEPYLMRHMTEGYFKNGEVALYYRMFHGQAAKRTIVISHGFTEYADKYNETVYYYLKAGYDVYIMEHRGHGKSTREVEDESLVYVKSFDDYQADFKCFMDQVVMKNNGSKPLYLYAHSMGGAIATRFLQEHPEYFKAAVLSSPMVAINTGSVSERVANLTAKVFTGIGKGDRYAFGYGPYKGIIGLERSSTKSAARYEYYTSKEVGNKYHHMNGPAFSWLKAAIAQTKYVLRGENLAKITIPVLVFQAEKDALVKEEGLYRLVSGISDVTFKFAKGSKHQVFSTDNSILIPYYNTIFEFYEKH